MTNIETAPLAGVQVPLHSEDHFELEVVGRIPEALAGAYYRNGPNPQFEPDGPYFPFLGDGMIHAFFLEPNKNGGRATAVPRSGDRATTGASGRARYRNRWVRTPKWHAENKAGRLLFTDWGEANDPAAANLKIRPANIHVVHHAGKLLALAEHSEPFEVDPVDLERGGFLNTGGKRTAHPKIDPETGEMLWFAYWAGEGSFNNLIDYGITDKAEKVTRRDRFTALYASIIHDFLMTRNYVLFPVMPLTGDLARAEKGLPPMAWEPDRGGYIGVMKRSADVDSIRWFEIEPRFFLHAMNAWEDGDKIHCDVTEFPRAPYFPNPDGSPAPEVEARLTRWTIELADTANRARPEPIDDNVVAWSPDHATQAAAGSGDPRRTIGQAKCEQIDDLNSEMPRIDDRFAGRPYRHGWYLADIDSQYAMMHDAIAHIDLATGQRTVRKLERGDAASEPVFVPRSVSAPEGDGYIITLAYRAESDTSELLILDAQSISSEPAAVLKMPRAVTAGTHGSFVPA